MLAPAENKAAELGRQKHPWWPDWRGHYVAIVACGPSAKTTRVKDLAGRVKVIAIKEAVELAPFADVVYGCDYPWWEFRRGLPQFKGLKFSFDPRTHAQYTDVHQVFIPDRKSHRLLLEQPLVVGSGRNSAFQSLNLALQFAAAGVLLIGVDLNAAGGLHFYGRNGWANANNPDAYNFRHWLAAFNGVADCLKARGVDVANASRQSMLNCFRKGSLEEILRGWGV